MNRLPQARSGSPVMRAALTCALAAAVVLPSCASASSTPHRSPSPAAVSSEGVLPTTAPRARKPITVKVSPRLFGVHDATMQSLAKPGVGAIRLWDSGVMWSALEPADGVFDWDRLDQYVQTAHARGTEVTLVLAGTPAWAVDPTTASSPASPWDAPKVDAYRAFVAAVMERYAPSGPFGYRGIANYQVWNESNIKTFWTGTPAAMADLTHTVWQVRKAVDPGAKVIAPSMVVRMGYQLKAAKAFYHLSVAGKPVWRYVDAAAFSLYPVDSINGRPAGPEDSMNLVKEVRAFLAADRVSSTLPIWNAEINYGYRVGSEGGQPAVPISNAKQAAYVLRTYILNAANGLPRVFWYRYDFTAVTANTRMVEIASPSTLSPAGMAFYRVQKWLKGGTLVGTATARPCAKDRHGTYTCLVRYGTGKGRIYWNPTKSVKKRTVRSARKYETGLGAVHRIRRHTISVNYLPTLVRSSS